jgi:glycosyltransferase involved in cell wall biosynthesis
LNFLFLGKGPDEASTRYRINPLADYLIQSGHQVTFRSSEMSLPAKLQMIHQSSQFDVVLIQRKLFPVWFVNWLAKRAGRLVFDFDDAIFVRSSGESSPARDKKFAATCRAADLVLAGNDYLAAEARQYSDQVLVAPTAVDVQRYESDQQKGTATTLVWIGSSSTRRYLDMLTPVLDALAQRLPNLKLKVIADFELHLESLTVENIPWSAETEAAELSSSDIGIAPMVNNAWTRGKCALKVIQYMAAGLPVVSDRCGANQTVIAEGQTGFLVDNEADWIEAIVELTENPERAQQMGGLGRLRAKAYFDLPQVVELVSNKLIALWVLQQAPNGQHQPTEKDQ